MYSIKRSELLFERAKNFIPGGVNSPVRAFRGVGGNPIFFKKAAGAYLYDEDGNRYIDLINSWGPMILGHAYPEVVEAVKEAAAHSFSFGAPTEREIEIAELIIEMVPSLEKIRMVNSGTEATMSAIRLARGYTGRNKILKFEGCYHGHGDSFLIAAGSGAATMGIPDSLGVTKGVAQDTLTAPYNDLTTVKNLFAVNHNEIAAVILEPVAGNMGCVLPKPDFIKGLQTLCKENGTLLIFDEVMTGFRLAKGGAQEVFGITPDLSTYGKIIGGGMPVGAYGGRKEIMDCVAPLGKVYQAGTLSGNPIAMAAGYATLKILNDNPQLYTQINETTQYIANSIRNVNEKMGFEFTVTQLGSMYSLFFTKEAVFDFTSAKTSNTGLFANYFHAMLKRGVYLAPSQFETLFVCTAIDRNIADAIIEAHEEVMKEIM